MLLTQPKLWPSCQLRAKYEGASGAQGGLLKAREPPSPGSQSRLVFVCSHLDGSCRRYHTTGEQRLSKLFLKTACGDNLPPHASPPCESLLTAPNLPHGSVTAPLGEGTHSHESWHSKCSVVCSAVCSAIEESRTSLRDSLTKALQESHLDSAWSLTTTSHTPLG